MVLVETVGVGQSEAAVHASVDCLCVLALAGAGDELQAVKRGLLELADVLVVNKADGDNERGGPAWPQPSSAAPCRCWPPPATQGRPQ